MTNEIAPLSQIESYIKDKEYYSPSSLQNWKSCHQYYEYSNVMRIASGRPSPNADFGNCIHKGLAVLHETGDVEKALLEYSKEWQELLSVPAETNPRFEKRLLHDNGIDLLLGYVEKYRNEPIVVPEGFVEVGFIFQVEDFYVAGRMDLVAPLPGMQANIPWDHKTTKTLDQNFWQRFSPDEQITIYIVANRRVFPDAPRMAAINALNVVTNIGAKTVEEKSVLYSRFTVTRTEQDLRQWEEDVRITVGEIRQARERGTFTRNTDHCNSYGSCPFKEACLNHKNASIMKLYPRREDTLRFIA